MNAPVPELLSKGAFAKLINVSPGRVSQYISEGKLSGPALEGQGRSAKIRVAEAQAQLKQKLDIGQLMGNGLDTRLDGAAQATQTAQAAPVSATPALPSDPDYVPTIEDQLKQEKLLQAKIASRKAFEDENARRGRFTETELVQAEMVRLASKLLQTFEGALPDLANAVAAQSKVPSRDVLHVLRKEFRNVRKRAAKVAAEEAEDQPETIATEIEVPTAS
ncbi:hypothetical protein [Roseibium album]|uniref:hypothetical protein n=1 Tax=Roseibium album TaxID=311410 RepID=UPI00391B9A74